VPPDRAPDAVLDALTDATVIGDLARLVFRSRLCSPASFGPPAFAVTPSYVGAQHTLEGVEAELRG
jgi:hypothetical protein